MDIDSAVRALLVRQLFRLAGPAVIGAALAGCGSRVDRVACIDVLTDEECPSEGDARKLMPDSLCETPEVKHVSGATFVERRDSNGWDSGGGEYWDTHDACCYEGVYKEIPGTGCVIGRPMIVGGQPVVAAVVRHARAARASVDLTGLSAADRRAVGAMWRDIAQLEHASIAAFARVVAELRAHGAPAGLIDAALSAARDEVRHAQAAFALASAYLDELLGPGPLNLPSRPVPSLAQLAAETVREGCVGETLSVLLAGAQLARAQDPAARAALQSIVADELRHAELAWQTVRWALEVGGADVRDAVADAFDKAALPRWQVETATDERAAGRHGYLGEDDAHAVLARGLREVVGPAAMELLST